MTGVSAEARRFGIREGIEVSDALERCPGAAYRATRLRRYREISAEISAILRRTTECLESEGLAGFYLECPLRADPLSSAAELCVALRAELGMEAVAGVGPTRFVAHLAAHHHAPGEIRGVPADQVLDFLGGLPVTEIWGLGPAAAEKLAGAGITTIGHLQGLSRPELEALVGRTASSFLTLARGEDRDPLRPLRRPRSLSQEKTLPLPSCDLQVLGEEIAALAGQLQAMLRRERRAARTVSLGLDYVDGDRVTRTRTVPAPVTEQNEIGEIAAGLLGRTQASARQCRRLRLQVSKLVRAEDSTDPRQLRLF